MKSLKDLKSEWESVMEAILIMLRNEIKSEVDQYNQSAEKGRWSQLFDAEDLINMMQEEGFWKILLQKNPFENLDSLGEASDLNDIFCEIMAEIDWEDLLCEVVRKMHDEYCDSEWEALFGEY